MKQKIALRLTFDIVGLQAIFVILLIFLANIRLAGALYCLRCFGVPDACSRPSNSQSGAVSVEQCAPNQYWCKSWATQYNVMMGCTETCRPTDPQTLCCQKDMCNCFGSNCYEQLLTSNPPVWFTAGHVPPTTWRPQPPPQTPPPQLIQQTPPLRTAVIEYWPPWWTSTYYPPRPSTTQRDIIIDEPTETPNRIDKCFECYDCGQKNQPTPAFCPPHRANYCVTAVVNFVGLRRIDRFCSDICPPRMAGYVSTQCCATPTCNVGGLNVASSPQSSISSITFCYYVTISSFISSLALHQ